MADDNHPKSERLRKLEQRQEKLKRDIAKERSRLAQKQRRDDTRRKIIAGALALEHRDKNQDTAFAQIMDRLLDKHVKGDTERALFDLAPLPQNDNAKAEPNTQETG